MSEFCGGYKKKAKKKDSGEEPAFVWSMTLPWREETNIKGLRKRSSNYVDKGKENGNWRMRSEGRNIIITNKIEMV